MIGTAAFREAGFAELDFNENRGALIVRQSTPQHDIHGRRRLIVQRPFSVKFAK